MKPTWQRSILTPLDITPRHAQDLDSVVICLDGFAGEALVEEADQLGVTTEELAKFAVLYYLADLDSGRIARPTRAPHPPRRTPPIPGDSAPSADVSLFSDPLRWP